MKTVRSFLAFGLITCLLLLAAGLAGSQGVFDLPWGRVAGGGITQTTAAGFSMGATVGQPEAHNLIASGSGAFSLGSGMAYRLIGQAEAELFPIILSAKSGYNNILLAWNATNAASVTSYRILRAPVGSNNWAAIDTVSNLYYYDQDVGLEPGLEYCYQIDALDAGSTLVLSSNPSCAAVGELGLWIPETWAEPGSTYPIQVNIFNGYDLPIALAQIWIEYDGNVIQPLDVASTALTYQYDWNYSISGSGANSRVDIFTTSATAPPLLYGSGSLFWLTVEVLGTSGATSPIDLQEFVQGAGGSMIRAQGDPDPIPLNLLDGVFHAEAVSPYGLGDLNGNTIVETVDAAIALEIANGVIIPTPQQLSAGDINGDGRIGAADAAMILFYVVHGYWPPLNTYQNAIEHVESSPITISLNDVEAVSGRSVALTLSISSAATGWAGGEFTVVYPRDIVSAVTEVTATGVANGFDLRFNDKGNGLLTIAMASATPVSGNGPIATVTMNVKGGIPTGTIRTLALSEAALNDLNGRDFATALQQTIIRHDGSVTITEASVWHAFLPIAIK